MERFSYWEGVVTAGVIAVAVTILAVFEMRDSWRTECVRRGAAEWVVEDDGATEFHWLLEPKEKP